MNKGFTLIELLITITVISVGIFGAYIAIQQAINTIDYARSRLTAAFLAQEGVEIIKNIRDTNLLQAGVVWNEGLTAGEYETDYQDVEYLSPSLSTCTGCDYSSLQFLKKSDGDFYQYSSGQETRYKRKVLLEDIDPEHLRATITVYWKTRTGHEDVQLVQELYKWW